MSENRTQEREREGQARKKEGKHREVDKNCLKMTVNKYAINQTQSRRKL